MRDCGSPRAALLGALPGASQTDGTPRRETRWNPAGADTNPVFAKLRSPKAVDGARQENVLMAVFRPFGRLAPEPVTPVVVPAYGRLMCPRSGPLLDSAGWRSHHVRLQHGLHQVTTCDSKLPSSPSGRVVSPRHLRAGKLTRRHSRPYGQGQPPPPHAAHRWSRQPNPGSCS